LEYYGEYTVCPLLAAHLDPPLTPTMGMPSVARKTTNAVAYPDDGVDEL